MGWIMAWAEGGGGKVPSAGATGTRHSDPQAFLVPPGPSTARRMRYGATSGGRMALLQAGPESAGCHLVAALGTSPDRDQDLHLGSGELGQGEKFDKLLSHHYHFC